jgi:hypothetical protein
MGILCTSARPRELLKQIERFITENRITAWKHQRIANTDRFTLVTSNEQLADKSWFRAEMSRSALNFYITPNAGISVTKEIFQAYHQSFATIFTEHEESLDFVRVSSPPIPLLGLRTVVWDDMGPNGWDGKS